MFRNAVISMLLALLLALVSDSLPNQLAAGALTLSYIGVAFAIVSGLLSLFEQVEEPNEAARLHRSDLV